MAGKSNENRDGGSSGNVTKDKLKYTPFSTAADHKAARERLLQEEWTNMARADIRTELLINSDDCVNLRKIFEEGIACSSQEQKELFRVYDQGYQTMLAVSPTLMDSKEAKEGAFKALVESTTSAFMTARFRLIDGPFVLANENEKTQKIGIKSEHTKTK